MRYKICQHKQVGLTHRFTTGGFTLLELTLVVAMMGLIAMFSVTLSSGFLWRSDLSSAVSTTVASLRYAQALARAQMNDTDRGVHIETNQLIVFQGNNFENRDITKDEEYDLNSVTILTPINIIYQKFSGQPYVSFSEINLRTNEETTTININSEGTVSY
jgi:Tfp pilus assembly protein FimT